MPRYKLIVEFDGTPFVGWQRQANGLSVQEVIEAAGAALSGSPSPVYGAGRTDSGVHGLGMAAHIDLERDFPARTVMEGLNAHLRPHPVAILEAKAVTDEFHARFSCHARHYLYRVLNRRSPATLERDRVWRLAGELNVRAMSKAATALIGKHDFTTFRSAHCQADSPVKTLTTLTVSQAGDEVHFYLAAPSFLHNQVRSIVGSLAEVGLGRWPVAGMADALSARDRAACGPVAPAKGLYFLKADYPLEAEKAPMAPSP